MIIGILVKVNSIVIERKLFKKSSPLKRYWKKMRNKYKDANFFIYRATHSAQKVNFYVSDSIRYCPYCEEIRNFVLKKYEDNCPVCNISIHNCSVKMSNYPAEKYQE